MICVSEPIVLSILSFIQNYSYFETNLLFILKRLTPMTVF